MTRIWILICIIALRQSFYQAVEAAGESTVRTTRTSMTTSLPPTTTATSLPPTTTTTSLPPTTTTAATSLPPTTTTAATSLQPATTTTSLPSTTTTTTTNLLSTTTTTSLPPTTTTTPICSDPKETTKPPIETKITIEIKITIPDRNLTVEQLNTSTSEYKALESSLIQELRVILDVSGYRNYQIIITEIRQGSIKVNYWLVFTNPDMKDVKDAKDFGDKVKESICKKNTDWTVTVEKVIYSEVKSEYTWYIFGGISGVVILIVFSLIIFKLSLLMSQSTKSGNVKPNTSTDEIYDGMDKSNSAIDWRSFAKENETESTDSSSRYESTPGAEYFNMSIANEYEDDKSEFQS